MRTGNKPIYLIVHHAGGIKSNARADTSNITFSQVDNAHRIRWEGSTKSSLGKYIGYHYFIEKDGKVIQGRLDTDEGVHTRYYNMSSIGIGLAGNFDVTLPTDAQIASLMGLLKDLATKYQIPIKNINPHRRWANKSCFGLRLRDNWARNLLYPASSKPDYSQLQVNLTRLQTMLNAILLLLRSKKLGGVEHQECILPDNILL